MKQYRNITFGIMALIMLLYIIVIEIFYDPVRKIRIERIVDPLPDEELYYPYETWYPPYHEDDSCGRITLVLDC